MSRRRAISALRALALGAAALLPFAARPAQAHDHPDEITVKVNGTFRFDVKDAATCKATINATVLNLDPLVSVTPAQGFGVKVTFTVTAGNRTGTEYIFVEWRGEHVGGEGPCQEVSGSIPIKVNVVAEPEPTSAASMPNSAESGDPVNMFTGELTFSEPPDLSLGGPLPLYFQRHYASRMRIAFVVGDAGDNWRHNFEWRINTVGTVLQLTDERGKVLRYLKDTGVWVLQSATDIPYEVVQTQDGFTVPDPRSNRIYLFDAAGKLVEITDGKGNSHFLSYDPSTNKLQRVADDTNTATARGLDFVYTDGRLTLVSESFGFTPGRSVSFRYDGDDAVAFTDAAGEETEYLYDTDHADPALLRWREAPLGNRAWEQTYDKVGKVATQTDAFGNATRFSYGPPQRPGKTKAVGPDGKSVLYQHDKQGNLVRVTDQARKKTRLGADAGAQRRTAITGPTKGVAAYAYDPASGRIESAIDANGNETRYTYGARMDPDTGMTLYDMKSIQHPDGTSETFTHDANGNVLTRTDEANHTWTFTYDANGQMLTETNPRNATTTYTYDAFHNRRTATDASNQTTTYTYDTFQRLERIDHHDGTFETFAYDALNRVTRETDARGESVERTYDVNGNLRTVTLPGNHVTTYVYDAMDRVVRMDDALTNTSSATYDVNGRYASRADRAGQTTSLEHDAVGRLTQLTDQAGLAWQSRYDSEGHQTHSIDPLGNTIEYTFDGEGLVTAVTTPLGNVSAYAYDERMRMARHVDPAGRPIDYEYEPRGLPSRIDVGAGTVAADFEYDALGKPAKIVDPAGEEWLFAYDTRGRLASRTDPLGNATTFGYDTRDRVSHMTFPGGLGTLDVTYDAAGNVETRTFSDGTSRTYVHDGRNYLTDADGVAVARDALGNVVGSNGITIQRTDRERIASLTFAPGRTITYTYDARGLLLTLQDWVGDVTTFTHDEVGRLTQIMRPNGVRTTYAYDADGRMTQATEGSLSTLSFRFDGSGQILEAFRDVPEELSLEGLVETPVAVDAANQVVGFTYDALGRCTDDGARTYTWDLGGRMTSVTRGAATASYTYDAFGLPLTKTEGGVTDAWVWNHATDLASPTILRRDGNTLRYYVHTPDGRLLYSIDEGGGLRRWYHFDEAGNTLFLTDAGGQVTDSYAYSPYGRVAASTGTTENPFTFGGSFGVIAEGSDGLFRMRRRVYDSGTRRFLSRDPFIGHVDPRELNPYGYALGNPLKFVDPTGEEGQSDATYGTQLASNMLGVLGASIESQVPGVGRVGWTKTLAKVGKAGKVLGAAGTVFSALAEVAATDERMDRVTGRFSADNQAIWDAYNQGRSALWLLYATKRVISREKYRELLHQLTEEREKAFEKTKEKLTSSSVRVGVIATLNLGTNLIPGVGLVLDWSDHIDF